jgi:hypothetical protein
MMSYKRFIPSHVPTGAAVASDFSPLMFVGHRKNEHGRQKAALDTGEDEGGGGTKTAVTAAWIMAPGSDVAVSEPLPIGLVAGAQWCRCSDFIHP